MISKNTSKQSVRFFVVGGLCFCLGLVVQWLFTSILNYNYLVGYVIALITTALINWQLNRKWTFRSTEAGWKSELIAHQSANLLSILLSSIFYITLVSYFNVNYIIASVVISILMLIINFLTQKYLVFKK